MSDKEIIFSLYKAGKVYPNKKQVLRDISISFFYGAKIGVLGLNGAGKSSLLKIIAGTDKDFNGELNRSKGISYGMLEQEPLLDPEKTVREVVQEGLQEIVNIVNRYEEVNNKLGETMSDDEMNKLLEEQSLLQDKMDASNDWDLDSRLDTDKLIQTLAHEMVHVKQIAKGQLSYEGKKIFWKGVA